MSEVKRARKPRSVKPKATVAAGAVVENSAFGDAFGSALRGAPFDNTLSQVTGSNDRILAINSIDTLFRNLRGYLVSNFRQILSFAYAEIGLVQTLVDIPVDDGLRGGVKFKTKQLSEDQIQELTIFMDDKDDLTTAGTGAKWNRLYGGSGLVVMCDQDPTEPLDIEQIHQDEEVDFVPADIWELFWAQINPYPDFSYGPTMDDERPLTQESAEFFDYYGRQVHKSRVLTMKGIAAPSFIRPRLRGWGMSVVDTLIRSLNQYIKGTDLLFEVLDEFKVDVYRFHQLANTLLTNSGALKIRERIAHMNFFKNYQNAIALDANDEFDHKQLSFGGLADAMLQVRMQVAAEMRMPMTKLFGVSAAGFNSGEDDIEVYNAMVESQVRRKLKLVLLTMAKIRCQQLFGMIPTDMQLEFEPLRVLSSEQQENVKTQKYNRAISARQAGEITAVEFREICNKGNLFDVPLDTTDAVMDDLADEQGAADVEAGEDGDSDQEPKSATPKGGGKTQAKPAKDAKEAKDVKNSLTSIPRMWRPGALMLREALCQQPISTYENSAAFDRASYKADGGDGWIDSRREQFFTGEPVGVDKALWARARQASMDAFGKENWKFQAWWYLKMGGQFSHEHEWLQTGT